MKKSSTLTTTTSMPTSPTLSTQTLSASKISLTSSRCGSTAGSACGSAGSGSGRSACQSPVRPGSGCVDALKAKREEIEIETVLEKAKFYTSVCLGRIMIQLFL